MRGEHIKWFQDFPYHPLNQTSIWRARKFPSCAQNHPLFAAYINFKLMLTSWHNVTNGSFYQSSAHLDVGTAGHRIKSRRLRIPHVQNIRILLILLLEKGLKLLVCVFNLREAILAWLRIFFNWSLLTTLAS